jgi:hypothetical protein
MALQYAIDQRMRLIDFLLFHYGNVSRKEIMDYFGIEGAAATRDFAMYRSLAPANMVMNQTTKRWVKTESFVRLFP